MPRNFKSTADLQKADPKFNSMLATKIINKLILDGKKTETRRLWPKGRRVKVGSIHEARLKMFEKDSTFARLRILDVSHEKLGEIDVSGAAAEGYPSVASFIREFARINRIESAPENELLATPVWRVKFEVLKPDDA